MITRDDWLRAVKDVTASAAVPESDALTIKEFAQLMNIARDTATKQLLALITAGRAVATEKIILRTDGRRHKVRAFRLLPEPPA